MRDWYRQAALRDPTPVQTGSGTTYARTLLPWLDHEDLEPHAERLMAAAMGRYLRMTTALETQLINPVALWLAEGRAPWPVPERARTEARRLYCDEAWHALQAHELAEPHGTTSLPTWFQEIRTLDPVGRFLFAFVSETLVSVRLKELARDSALRPELRRFAADHARDEAWHAVYFAERFEQAWQWFAPAQRDQWGPQLPRWIADFLLGDVAGLRADVRGCGGDPGLVAVRLDPTSARQTLSALQRAGALDHPATRATCEEIGLT